MDFGLFMMPLHPPRRSFADAYDRDIALIVQADRLGYHEAWIGEHITEMWENAPVPELLIAKALALTERIIFATGVTMLPLHHPVDTAHRIAMLDHMARGRFYWGIGVRSLPTDLQLYGIEYTTMDDVREQGKEALEVILGLWQAEHGRFDYAGKYYRVHAPEALPEPGGTTGKPAACAMSWRRRSRRLTRSLPATSSTAPLPSALRKRCRPSRRCDLPVSPPRSNACASAAGSARRTGPRHWR